jgi:hypothetical protein
MKTKKKSKTSNSKEVVLKVNKNYFSTKNNKKFTQAAKKAVKEIDNHFKKDGWDLDLSFQIEEVFYLAFGEHLSDYLLKELFSNPKKGYYISTKDRFGLVIRKKIRKKKVKHV